MYVGCVGVIAFVHGLSLMAGSFVNLLNGWLGVLMVAGIIFGTIFKVIFDMRLGYSLARSLLHTLLIGVLVYVSVFGIFWYLKTNIMDNPHALDLLPGLPTPTAHP